MAVVDAQIILSDLTSSQPLSTMVQLAAIPEEDVWLAKQKSAHKRQAYRLDALHFMATLGVATTDELRRVDHRAVIARERRMREGERSAPPTIRRFVSAAAPKQERLSGSGVGDAN